MRIVVATLYGLIGGSTKVLLAAADALRKDHVVIVRAPIKQADSIMPWPASSYSLESLRQKIGVIPSLLSIFCKELFWIKKNRPDVVYVHDSLSLYIYGLIGRIYGLTVVWHVHMREGRGLVRLLRDLLCDAKIFVSRFIVGDEQRKAWLVIRNPVDVHAQDRRQTHPVFTIGMIGSISRLKNQELGICVIAELLAAGRAVQLFIFGEALDHGYRRHIEVMIQELQLETAVFLRGFVPVEQALSEIDMLLVCSTYESFGLATVETLACGIPVVASDIEAHREIAEILCTPALTLCPIEPVAMAMAIAAARPDKSAAQRVHEEFSPERFAAEIADFFRTQVAAPARMGSPVSAAKC
jgi:glycosyltransferase involved in cell wall biosynthesis